MAIWSILAHHWFGAGARHVRRCISLASKLTIKINGCLTTVIVDSHHYLFTEDSHFYNEGQTGDNLVSLGLSRGDLTLIKSFTLQ